MQRKNEIQARVDWIVRCVGLHRIGDVKLQIHADREKFNAFLEEVGHADCQGFDVVEVLSPCKSGLRVELCHFEGHKDGWYVYAMPRMDNWTQEERGKWIALNN